MKRRYSGGNWVGGTESEIVASDAKNSTPISAVAYVLNGSSTWHIFCEPNPSRSAKCAVLLTLGCRC